MFVPAQEQMAFVVSLFSLDKAHISDCLSPVSSIVLSSCTRRMSGSDDEQEGHDEGSSSKALHGRAEPRKMRWQWPGLDLSSTPKAA